MSLTQISMTDLHQTSASLSEGDIVLDVRTPSEYAAGHVKGSLNIPHDQVAAHVDKLRKFARIYIHCRSGKRAAAAAETLLKAGFKNLVCISTSGMEDWIASGFPVVK